MSDRVAYPVGNTNGRDHLYWPLITPAFAASEGLPARQLGVSLATMMAMSWRVKKWRISGMSVSGVLHQVRTHSPGVTTTYDIATSFEIPDFDVEMVNGATREALLLDTFFLTFASGASGGLRNGGWIGSFAGEVEETTIYSYDSQPPEAFTPPTSETESGTFDSLAGGAATFQIGDGPSTGGNNIVYYDPGTQLFYPEFSFGVSIFPHFFLGFAPQFRITADMRDISGGDGSLTVDPVVAPSFQLPLDASGFIYSGVGAGSTTASGTVDAMMTAVEFWPYKNSLGNPVYDSASGAELVSPFS